ncbi:MAG: hypothetical protein NZL88_11850, partial [Gaiellaceae bacterium]|nr:hypothetical protein [Gaiellaceae bacterium]
MIDAPKVDWLALGPSLALLGASGIALLASVLVPEWMRKAVAAGVAFVGFVLASVLGAAVFVEATVPETAVAGSMVGDRLAAFGQVVLGMAGAGVVLLAWAEPRRRNQGELYALLAAAGAGMAFFLNASNLMTLFLGLEWFSLCLYVLVAYDTERAQALEAGLKYLVVGG